MYHFLPLQTLTESRLRYNMGLLPYRWQIKADDQAISNLELISESETSEDGCDGEEQGKQW